jgi:hypothetical protein
MSNISIFSFSEETTKKIYYEYIKECLVIFQNIYKEIISFIVKNAKNDENILLDESILNIQSWADILNRNTISLGEFIGSTSSLIMNYNIEPESWREDMYVEISEKSFFSSSFTVEFVLDFPKENYHLIIINDRGVIYNHAIESNNEADIHTITLMKGIRLAFTNRLIEIIREDISIRSKGSCEVFAPTFLGQTLNETNQGTQFFIPRLPFNPNHIYLTRLSWVLSILNSIDTLIKKTYFFAISYITVDTETPTETPTESVLKNYARSNDITNSTFLFAP